MFAAVYSFKVREGMEEDFIASWKALTSLIYEFEGSLGSRLHLSHENEYIAYAQWPDKQRWETSGIRLPEEADTIREMMKSCCLSMETLFELETCADLLKSRVFTLD